MLWSSYAKLIYRTTIKASMFIVFTNRESVYSGVSVTVRYLFSATKTTDHQRVFDPGMVTPTVWKDEG